MTLKKNYWSDLLEDGAEIENTEVKLDKLSTNIITEVHVSMETASHNEEPITEDVSHVDLPDKTFIGLIPQVRNLWGHHLHWS